jgi:hypothetical protein
MAKYDPLHVFLAAHHGREATLPFSELEQILDADLPPSARKHREWWANEREGMHTHAHAWMKAGWLVDTVNFTEKWVRFVRVAKPRG